MKTSFITLIIILLIVNISYTQDCSEYDNLIQEGNKAFTNKNYERAIKRYNLAMLNCPEKTKKTQKKILQVFTEIERLKIDAEKAFVEIQAQQKTIIEKNRIEKKILEEKIAAISAHAKLEEEKVELNKVLTALKKEQEKNERIINSFYFYAGNFALAHNGAGYGFVDKDGNVVIDHKYDKALPFDNDIGLAYVEENYVRYLIDTLGTEYLTADNKKSMHSNTEAIDFRANSIKKINFPKKHYDLEILLLDKNKLNSLPPIIRKLESLKVLSIADNNLSIISEHIGSLENLIVLDLSYNTSIQTIPNEIGKLEKLQEVDLSGNKISTLPESLQNLKQLKALRLNDNSIVRLPKFIQKIEHLEYLDMAGNELTTLPAEIGSLSKLKRLNLVSNDLTSLPPEIGNLINLEELYLQFNQLKNLPDEIKNLQNLKELNLWGKNEFSLEEKRKIKKLLPNCNIRF